MGSSFSIQSRDKRRRSNRLSKPPSNITTLSTINCGSSQPLSSSSSPASSNPAEWQNPWTGAVIPINSPDAESSGRRSQSFPSASVYPEGPWTAHRVGRSQSIVREKREIDPRSPTTSSSTSGSLSRKTSVRPGKPAAWSEPRSSLAPPACPKRSYSVQSPPPRANGTRYSSNIEDATSSNTHFMVDSQGFSLIRRRSLLTRPGIATRRSSKNAVRRLPSPIDQKAGFSSTEPIDELQNLPWPLSDSVDSSHPDPFSLSSIRPPTPNDFEYTHLGALKLGSLRVVNCSTSPCPSDRTRLNQVRSPSPIPSEKQLHTTEPWHLRRDFQGLGGSMAGPNSSGDFELARHEPPSEVGRLMGLSERYAGYDSQGAHQHGDAANLAGHQPDDLSHSFSHNLKEEDYGLVSLDPHAVPPNAAITQRHPSTEAEDEGILVSDERDIHPGLESSISTQWDSQHSKSSKSSRSHKKVDSGYSSAASVRSMQDARVRVSIDSQSSAHHSPGNRRFTLHAESAGRGLPEVKPQVELSNQLPIHRHLSLQGSKSTPKPDLGTWPTDLSTMCHENSQAPVTTRLRSSSYTPQISSRPLSLPRYCAQLRSLEGVPVEPLPSARQLGSSTGTSSHSIYRTPSSGRPSKRTANGAVQPSFSNKTDGNGDLNGPSFLGVAGRGHSHKAVGIRKNKSISRPGSIGEVSNTPVGLEPLEPLEPLPAKGFPGMGADSLPPRHKWPFEPATNEEIDPNGCPAESRGRTRSRSIDCHRRRLSKPQQGPNIYTAASPFIFH